MKLGIKNMTKEIEGDGLADVMSALFGAIGGLSDEKREHLLEEAADMAATRFMEQTIEFMGKAMKMVGDDDDPMLNILKVLSKCNELVLINMLARLKADTPRETLEDLTKNINEMVAVKMRDDADVVDLFNQIQSEMRKAGYADE